MDPNACFREIARLFEGPDGENWPRLEELAESLHGWLSKDGFPPDISGNRALNRLIAMRVCESILVWEVSV